MATSVDRNRVPWVLYRNSSASREFAFAAGTSMTSWQADIEFRSPDGALLVAFSSAGASPAITISDVADTVTVAIPQATVAGFTWSSAEWDLVITDGTGAPWRYLGGTVEVREGVTRV